MSGLPNLAAVASKATPGPWEYRIWGYESDTWPERRVSVGTRYGQGAAVCISPRYATQDQSVSDAALIAAAPEMAALLQECAGMLRQIVVSEPIQTESGTAWPSFSGTLQNIAAAALARLAEFDRGLT